MMTPEPQKPIETSSVEQMLMKATPEQIRRLLNDIYRRGSDEEGAAA
ncbi:MAG: hypothetical protein AAGF68_02155 [Pseudomonadota bacterium]